MDAIMILLHYFMAREGWHLTNSGLKGGHEQCHNSSRLQFLRSNIRRRGGALSRQENFEVGA